MKRIFFTCLLCVCAASVFASDLPESAADLAFHKLSVKVKKQQLASKDCEKLGFVDEEKNNIEYEYDGYVYDLEFRNNEALALGDLQVECRFFYTLEKSWRTSRKRDSETEQKFERCSLQVGLDAGSKYKVKTDPFVIQSRALPSGYYYNNGKPEVVEAEKDGLWVRVSFKTADGRTIHHDFCEPKSLSSRVAWDGKSP